MPPRAVLLLVGALALAPGRAAAGVPVAIHPFKVPGLVGVQRADFHAVLQAAVLSGARRGILSPRSPLLLPAATCGDPQTPTCLADAARGGLILAGRGELRRGVVIVTAALYDAKGRRTREVRFPVDLVIENLRPVSDALVELEAEVEPDGTIAGGDAALAVTPLPPAPAKAPAPAAPAPGGPKPGSPYAVPLPPPPVPRAPAQAPKTAPAPPPAAVAKAPPAKEPAAAAPRPPPALAPAPPRPAPPGATPLAVSAPAAPSGAWKRTAGPWLTGTGLALIAGGAAVGILNKREADDLEARYARGTLTPSDRAAYDRVKRDNVVSTALFAAGGVAAASGLWIWISAPSAGQPALASVGGRF